MQLHYLLVVVFVSDVKVMSSTVAVIFVLIKHTAITRGGAPIGAGGVMTPTFRGKGGRGDIICAKS